MSIPGSTGGCSVRHDLAYNSFEGPFSTYVRARAPSSPMLSLSPEDGEVVPLAGPGLPADGGEGALDVGAGPLEEDVAAVDGGCDGADPDLDVGVEALALLDHPVHEPPA